jgi:hypothetical protein
VFAQVDAGKAVKTFAIARLRFRTAILRLPQFGRIPSGSNSSPSLTVGVPILIRRIRRSLTRGVVLSCIRLVDDEKLVLEEAARSVGPIPTKATHGSLAWRPPMPAEMINESTVA